MARVVQIKNVNELRAFAGEFVEKLKFPTLLLLCGDLGAGKTELSKAMVSALGGGVATSPTFAIHHQYSGGIVEIDHFDLYRLEASEDLNSSGLVDRLMSPSGLVIIEWADRLEDAFWPSSWARIKLEFTKNPDGSRTIKEVTLV